jgi:class 3 adenylate cyclase
MLCVLTGDIKGFGGLIRAGVDAGVRQALEDAVRKWARETIASEVVADTVSVVHDDPILLAQVARHLMDEVYRAPGQPRLRIALHYGEVQTRQRAIDGTHEIAGGEAVLCAARVEPHVEPGQIWVTEQFRAQLAERPSLWRTTSLLAPGGAAEINVKKEGGTEPDLWVRLHRLEF